MEPWALAKALTVGEIQDPVSPLKLEHQKVPGTILVTVTPVAPLQTCCEPSYRDLSCIASPLAAVVLGTDWVGLVGVDWFTLCFK